MIIILFFTCKVMSLHKWLCFLLFVNRAKFKTNMLDLNCCKCKLMLYHSSWLK